MNEHVAKSTVSKTRHRLGLRKRILFFLGVLTMTAVIGGMITAWYTLEARRLLEQILDRDLLGLRIAEQLSGELNMQKGYATYYAISHDETYLRELAILTDSFEQLLNQALQHSYAENARELLELIARKYHQYVVDRLRVIDLYSQGRDTEGSELHWQVRKHFDELATQTEALKKDQGQRIRIIADNAKNKAKTMIYLAWSAMAAAVFMSFVLGYMLIRKVLDPVRRLVQAGQGEGVSECNEIEALDIQMHGLMDDMNRVREHVMQSEKLALAGTLAAGVAHSVRNPLTSVKMRLFSLGRSLRLDSTQAEDFEVITEEIGHIDTILQHFLEFARSPAIKKEHTSLAEVVENAIRLLRHRLDSYGIEVETDLEAGYESIDADPESLKEVLVNLLLNACEAMPGGGRIRIAVASRRNVEHRKMAVLSVRDWGPGIPEKILEHIFEPFFSTKEDGSGLGLAITKRIVMEHGGTFKVFCPEDGGALFEIALPSREF